MPTPDASKLGRGATPPKPPEGPSAAGPPPGGPNDALPQLSFRQEDLEADAPPPLEQSATPWFFTDPELGLRLPGLAAPWTKLEAMPGAVARCRHAETASVLLILAEGEATWGDPAVAPPQEVATDTCARYLGSYEELKCAKWGSGGRQALFFSATGQEHALCALALEVHGVLVKLLLLAPLRTRAAAEGLFDGLCSRLELLPQTGMVVANQEKPVRYDVRCGIPAGQWAAALAAEFPRAGAVCHRGEFQGVLKLAELNARLAAGSLDDDSLVWVGNRAEPQDRAWTPVRELRKHHHQLAAPRAPWWRHAWVYAGMACLIGVAVALLPGIYWATKWVPILQAAGSVVVGLVFLAVSPVISVMGYCGMTGLRGVRDELQRLIGFGICLALVCAPLFALMFVVSALIAFVALLLTWLLYLLLFAAAGAVLGVIVGTPVGLLTNWLDDTAANLYYPPKVSAALWAR